MSTAPFGTLLHYIHQLAYAQPCEHATDRQLLEAFIARRDEASFATLVARHGPMVLHVCRRILNHDHDVEDAFQATFLVLARHSKSIRNREVLPNWLHGVAYRTAMKAKQNYARRRNLETRLREQPNRIAPSPPFDEVRAILDEEIQRLPESFRTAFVLCVLEGKSGPQAARELGVKEGTVSSRLTRARQQLQRQLTRRGIHLSAVPALVAIANNATDLSVSAALAHSTVCAGCLIATGEAIPEHLAALADGVTQAMLSNKLKIFMALLLAVSLVAGAGVLAQQGNVAQEQLVESQQQSLGSEQPKSTPGKPPAVDEKGVGVEVNGRVVDASGMPLAGAKLFLCDKAGRSAAPQPATDRDGRFRFSLSVTDDLGGCTLAAMAEGLGLDWIHLRPTESSHNLTLRLPADEPIRGKVVDLEGKPVAGAEVRIVELSTTESGTLDEFLKQWAADSEKSPTGSAFNLIGEKWFWEPETIQQLFIAKTGRDGTFRISGIGRDRGLMLGVRGPKIADHYVRVLTRPDYSPQPVRHGQVALSGPELAVAVGPEKPILGTLRDAQTKEPLAGVRVFAYTPDRPTHWWWQPVETITDSLGRYRLDGLAKTARQIVKFDPGAGALHMHRFDEIGDSPGFAPMVHNTELLRGIVVSGQVTDRSTGRPVRARVVYAPLWNNEHYASTPGYKRPETGRLLLWIASREMVTGSDGRYRLTTLPGPGALFVRAVPGAGKFIRPVVPKEERKPDIFFEGNETFNTLGMGDLFPMSHLHAYRLIDPALDATTLTVDFMLDPGVRRRGRLLDPEGRPLTGAEAFEAVLSGAEFTAEALNPAKPRRLLFWHDARKLARTVVLRGDEPEPVTVRLQPLASLSGRAIQKNGEPLVGYVVTCHALQELTWPAFHKFGKREPILTDKEGRFRVTDLPAELLLSLGIASPKRTSFFVILREKILLESGKIKDLGELRGEPYEP